MLLRRVIPCLDVDKGRVVKGTNFVDIRDAGDPVELACRYEAEGGDEIVFLDITASHEKRDTIVELARRTANDVFIPFTIGGGIRSVSDAQDVLDAGADKVSVNSAAVARPELIGELAEVFGSQCAVLAIDAKRVDDHYEVFVNGGRTPVGRDAVEWAREGARRGSRSGSRPLRQQAEGALLRVAVRRHLEAAIETSNVVLPRDDRRELHELRLVELRTQPLEQLLRHVGGRLRQALGVLDRR